MTCLHYGFYSSISLIVLFRWFCSFEAVFFNLNLFFVCLFLKVIFRLAIFFLEEFCVFYTEQMSLRVFLLFACRFREFGINFVVSYSVWDLPIIVARSFWMP